MRVVFAGTPEFAVPALTALLQSRHEVAAVLTQPDRPRGRGRQLASSAVKQAAERHGIPILQPQSLRRDPTILAGLVSLQPDALIVVAYGLMLPPPVLHLPRYGCLNIHASLLPRWRGAAPIQRAVLAGDAQTGITIMQMEEGLDTGPILLQQPLAIESSDTAAALHDRLAALGATTNLNALDALEDGSLRPRPQPTAGVTYAAKISKAEAVIDWTHSAASIVRQVRAFVPWPIAETRFEGEPLRIHAAALVSPSAPAAAPTDLAPASRPAPTASPGTVIGLSELGVIVSCGEAAVVLLEVQRPGRRTVSGRDFGNTHALLGRRFE